RVVDEAVGAGLALQTSALSGLDDEQADRLADLLRKLLASTEAG
ncbi:MAG: MarR family transcriptional regulator, partial [Streptomyces sp.]|nr:MarR family transcriptional regulator [Streptomyces sp.]